MAVQQSSKRLDLQGIRGLAILSVLGFHFYPYYFPNGYLGVDQFFVLSGFLMCMLLKRSENMPIFSLITIFYTKRFKRILPLYLLVICGSLIALYTVFPDSAIETNTQSASKALVFLSNRRKTDAEDYFQIITSAVDVFTHTWSLSVEIQFYFIVPLIFIIFNRFSIKFQFLFYFLTGLLSYLLFFFSEESQAFNSVFSRIWQFIIGMMVYLKSEVRNQDSIYFKPLNQHEDIGSVEEKGVENLEEKKKIRSPIKNLVWKLLLITLALLSTMSPIAISAVIARPFVTVSTGIVMLISMDDYFLSNKLLTYIGDISYSLYLIHWPIYAYWKITFDNDQIFLLLSLLASCILAVIVFETFEKWYLHLSSTRICIFVTLLVIMNVSILNNQKLREFYFDNEYLNEFNGVLPNMTIDDAEEMNKRFDIDDKKNNVPTTCVYSTGEGPYGLWCEPLYPSWQRCETNITDFENYLKEVQPDVTFILSRFISSGNPFPDGITDTTDDPMYKYMKERIEKLKQYIKKKIYILNAIPWVDGHAISRIVKNIKANKTLVEIDKSLVNLSSYQTAGVRYRQLVQDCGEKCELIDYHNEFYNNSTGTFRYYDDRGISYFNSLIHLSPLGLEKVRHLYHDICESL